MKTRKRIEKVTGITQFDITADIIPKLGAGGVTFGNVITDFESVLTNTLLDGMRKIVPILILLTSILSFAQKKKIGMRLQLKL